VHVLIDRIRIFRHQLAGHASPFSSIVYASTSAICCWVSFCWSPHGIMENVGFAPDGRDPCCTNRSSACAKVAGSLDALATKVRSRGFRTGMLPSLDPGLGIPTFPFVPWHV
jgi:hypothetical protein